MAQETAALVRRQALPKLLRIGAERIHDRAPDSLVICRPHFPAHGPQMIGDRAEIGIRQPGRAMGRRVAMAARQQAAAGQGIDAAAMAGIEQGDDAVHHGQPGADQQHRRLRIQVRRRPRIPGIAEIMRRGVLVRENCRRPGRPRRLHSGGRCRPPRPARRGPVRSPWPRPGPDAGCGRGRSARSRCPADPGCRRHRAGAARRYRPCRPRRRRWRCCRAAEPIHEMIGLVDEGAHAAGAHIQQMVGVAGGIGEAAAELGVLLDQIDPAVGQRTLEQLHRQQRAAETGADDRDPGSCC